MRRAAIALVLAPLWATTLLAQQPARRTSDEQARYEHVLASAYAPDAPGAVALVARAGEIVYRGAAGMANLELGVPLEPDMVFEVGSITKQFTAACIMMLADEGKLSVDDPLSKFLPDYPNGENITVAHLLTHTSGIVSYTDIPEIMETQTRNDRSVEEIIEWFRDRPPVFQPGERFAYNNSGYVLLGAIIEEVGGAPYAEFVQERIFTPLGMENSYYGSQTRVIPRRAAGYGGEADRYTNAQYLSMTLPYAAGALMSTVDDLYMWNQALHGGKVVSAESYQRMITPFVLNNGEPTDYAYGLVIGDVRGHHTIQHGGGIFGYLTSAIYLPGEDAFVAVFSNNAASDVGPGFVASKLAAIAVGDPFPEFSEVMLDESVLQRYVGVYKIDDEAERVVTVEDGALYTQRTGGAKLRAFPASETQFYYKQSLSYFEFVMVDVEAAAMLMHQNGAKEAERAVKVSDEVPTRTAIELDPEIYDRYVGVYELRPGFELTISREDDKLMCQATGQAKFQLFPESETEFFVKEFEASLTFVVGDDGRASEVILHQGGRDITAARKE